MNCDFKGQNLTSVNVSGEDCGQKCWDNTNCTHFAYKAGKCYLKSGYRTFSQASSASIGACGIMGGDRMDSVSGSGSEVSQRVPGLQLAGGIFSVLVLVCIVILLYFLYRRRKRQIEPHSFDRITKEQIRTHEKIGEGNFCEVWKGYLTTKKGKKSEKVAIKLLKLNASDRDVKQFLQEALILDKIHGKTNIVKVFGICLDSRPNFLVMEYISGGSLHSYLSSDPVRDQLSHKHLLHMAMDVQCACAFLENKGYIHRDIAARNCLVETNSEKNSHKMPVVKLADFGLAKDEKAIYKTPDPDLPVAWVAPESFGGIFSIKTDVWSYGVLLFEIFSYGAVPFGKCSIPENIHVCPLQVFAHSQIQDYVCERKKTLSDLPPPCTDQSTELMKEIMRKCWSFLPDVRPTFKDVGVFLSEAERRVLALTKDETRLEAENKQERRVEFNGGKKLEETISSGKNNGRKSAETIAMKLAYAKVVETLKENDK